MALSAGSISRNTTGTHNTPSSRIMPPSVNSSIGTPSMPNSARSHSLMTPLLGPSSRIQPMPFTITGADSDR